MARARRLGVRRRGRRGFVLLAVLWVIVGLAALTLAVSLAAREAVAAARNRIHLMQAARAAEGCAERMRAAIAEQLGGGDASAAGFADVWNRLDRAVGESGRLQDHGCRVELRPAGTALDLNGADAEQLHRLLGSVGVRRAQADSLVAALLDWRDADGITRPWGAEAPDYTAAGLRPPRDGPLADVRELRRVRGWDRLPAVDGLVGVEPDRLCLNHAPLVVLETLPGFGPEVIGRMAESRARGIRVPDIAALAHGLSAAARDSLFHHYPALVAATTAEPDAWLLLASAAAGDPPVRIVVELRLVRAGDRAAVVRHRRWAS